MASCGLFEEQPRDEDLFSIPIPRPPLCVISQAKEQTELEDLVVGATSTATSTASAVGCTAAPAASAASAA